jgi:hypothetical protein
LQALLPVSLPESSQAHLCMHHTLYLLLSVCLQTRFTATLPACYRLRAHVQNLLSCT